LIRKEARHPRPAHRLRRVAEFMDESAGKLVDVPTMGRLDRYSLAVVRNYVSLGRKVNSLNVTLSKAC